MDTATIMHNHCSFHSIGKRKKTLDIQIASKTSFRHLLSTERKQVKECVECVGDNTYSVHTAQPWVILYCKYSVSTKKEERKNKGRNPSVCTMYRTVLTSIIND